MAAARSSMSSRISRSPRQGTLRRRARQRPAALGRPGQHGRLLHLVEAGRHRARPQSLPRRTPHRRSPVNYSGKFTRSSRTACGRTRARRPGPGFAISRASIAQADHRGRLGLPALDRLRPVRDIAREVGAVLMADIAHPAGLVAAGSTRRRRYRGLRHTTTHKQLRGPRGGMVMCRAQHAPALDRPSCPESRPVPHARDRRQGRGFREALTPACAIIRSRS